MNTNSRWQSEDSGFNSGGYGSKGYGGSRDGGGYGNRDGGGYGRDGGGYGGRDGGGFGRDGGRPSFGGNPRGAPGGGRGQGQDGGRVNSLGYHGDETPNVRIEQELFDQKDAQTAGINFDKVCF